MEQRLRIEDEPSRQPLAGPIHLVGWCPLQEAAADAPCPPKQWVGPATPCRQQAIDFRSLLPLFLPLSLDPKNPLTTVHTRPIRGWLLPSVLTAELRVSIQAQMEDKGVGLIDQAAPAPVQGLA